MKTKEQIELAQKIGKDLQDYIELSKVATKLKNKSTQENISTLIENIVGVIKSNIVGL